jgi:hypothetical protein
MVSSSIVEFVKQRDDACAALEIRVARKIPNLPFYGKPFWLNKACNFPIYFRQQSPPFYFKKFQIHSYVFKGTG